MINHGHNVGEVVYGHAPRHALDVLVILGVYNRNT